MASAISRHSKLLPRRLPHSLPFSSFSASFTLPSTHLSPASTNKRLPSACSLRAGRAVHQARSEGWVSSRARKRGVISCSMSTSVFERGAAETIVIRPTEEHLASIVFLHGLGDTGHGWSETVEELSLPNVKWILPSAPMQPVSINGGHFCPSWFDILGLAKGSPEDLDGIDSAAKFVVELLLKEQKLAEGSGKKVKLAVGGFSQGGALSLYLASRVALGSFKDGSDARQVPLSAAICLSGWLPNASNFVISASKEGALSDSKPAILMCHGNEDQVVAHSFGDLSAKALQSVGFSDLTFKSYRQMGHSACMGELADVREWVLQHILGST